MSLSAHAGPASCALAISNCVGGGKDVAKTIKSTRQTCQALRDCKHVCRDDHKDNKHDARAEKKDCKEACKSKKGKAKASCKKECRQNKRGDIKSSRKTKNNCLDTCRAQYKTPECKKARAALAKQLTVKGLSCGLKVSSACVAPVP